MAPDDIPPVLEWCEAVDWVPVGVEVWELVLLAAPLLVVDEEEADATLKTSPNASALEESVKERKKLWPGIAKMPGDQTKEFEVMEAIIISQISSGIHVTTWIPAHKQ